MSCNFLQGVGADHVTEPFLALLSDSILSNREPFGNTGKISSVLCATISRRPQCGGSQITRLAMPDEIFLAHLDVDKSGKSMLILKP